MPDSHNDLTRTRSKSNRSSMHRSMEKGLSKKRSGRSKSQNNAIKKCDNESFVSVEYVCTPAKLNGSGHSQRFELHKHSSSKKENELEIRCYPSNSPPSRCSQTEELTSCSCSCSCSSSEGADRDNHSKEKERGRKQAKSNRKHKGNDKRSQSQQSVKSNDSKTSGYASTHSSGEDVFFLKIHLPPKGFNRRGKHKRCKSESSTHRKHNCSRHEGREREKSFPCDEGEDEMGDTTSCEEHKSCNRFRNHKNENNYNSYKDKDETQSSSKAYSTTYANNPEPPRTLEQNRPYVIDPGHDKGYDTDNNKKKKCSLMGCLQKRKKKKETPYLPQRPANNYPQESGGAQEVWINKNPRIDESETVVLQARSVAPQQTPAVTATMTPQPHPDTSQPATPEPAVQQPNPGTQPPTNAPTVTATAASPVAQQPTGTPIAQPNPITHEPTSAQQPTNRPPMTAATAPQPYPNAQQPTNAPAMISTTPSQAYPVTQQPSSATIPPVAQQPANRPPMTSTTAPQPYPVAQQPASQHNPAANASAATNRPGPRA